MNTRAVALIGLYVIVGIFIYAWLAIPPGAGGDGRVAWGDVGTWIGALASFSATVAALWIAGDQHRKASQRDRQMAIIIATALCEELRGNRAQLDHTVHWRDYPDLLPEPRARNMAQSLRSIHITVFHLFKAHVSALGTDVGRAVTTAYASLARCHDIERSVTWPDPVRIEDFPWLTNYVRTRGQTVDLMLEEVQRAIVLLWPMVERQYGLPPPLNQEDENRYAAAIEQARAKETPISAG